MSFNYFYKKESEQFSFIRIPKAMMTEELFASLSIQAKILYGLLLDRLSEASKNEWLDEENKIYVIYQISEIMDDMNISKGSPFEKDILEGIYELVLETVLNQGDSIVIASNKYPMSLVRSKFLKLDSSHVEYVMDCLKSNTTRVRNIRKYMLATLFNAPVTIGSYYQAEVNHDLYGGN